MTEHLVLILRPEVQREGSCPMGNPHLPLLRTGGPCGLSSDPTQAPHQAPDLSHHLASEPAHSSHMLDPAQPSLAVLDQSRQA